MVGYTEWVKAQIRRNHEKKYGGSFRIHIGSTREKPVRVTLANMPREIRERVIDKIGMDRNDKQVKAFLEHKSKDEYEVKEIPTRLPKVKKVKDMFKEVKPKTKKVKDEKVEVELIDGELTKESLEAKSKVLGFTEFRKYAKEKFKVTGRSIDGIIKDILSGKKELKGE